MRKTQDNSNFQEKSIKTSFHDVFSSNSNFPLLAIHDLYRRGRLVAMLIRMYKNIK